MPAKPVDLFFKVTSYRNDNEITEEKKYEISDDDDGNINFTGTGQISMTAIEDQYYRIRMVDNIVVNMHQVMGLWQSRLHIAFAWQSGS